MESSTEGDDNKAFIEIDDGVAEHAILRGTPDQLMGDEVLQRITGMTDEGLQKALHGVKSPEDMQFGAALACLRSSLDTFEIIRCVSGNQKSDVSNPEYVKLVKAVAEMARDLDEIYKSIFLGCIEGDPNVARVLCNSERFVGDVIRELNKLDGGKSVS